VFPLQIRGRTVKRTLFQEFLTGTSYRVTTKHFVSACTRVPPEKKLYNTLKSDQSHAPFVSSLATKALFSFPGHSSPSQGEWTGKEKSVSKTNSLLRITRT